MKEFKDLVYHKWISDFKKAIALPKGVQYYCNSSLVYKIDKYLLYLRQEAQQKVVPDYFLIYKTFEINYPRILTNVEEDFAGYYEDYIKSSSTFIKKLLYNLMVFWVFFPHYLTKIYSLFKEINVPMDESAFIYIDFWLQIPKVIDDLLDHLLFLNIPIDKPISSNNPLIHFLDKVNSPIPGGGQDTFIDNFKKCRDLYVNAVLFEAFYCWLKQRPDLLQKSWDLYNNYAAEKLTDSSIKEFLVINVIGSNYFDYNKLSDYTWAFLAANIPLRDPFIPFCNSALLEYNSWSDSFKEKIQQDLLAKYNRRKLSLYELEGIKLD